MNGNLIEVDENLLLDLIDELDKCIGKNGDIRNIMVEQPVDFWKKLLELANRLEDICGPQHHIDPNVNCLWSIALMMAAWTGCVPKSKLYSTPKERPNLTDMQRREISEWLKELSNSIFTIYLMSYNLADKLREKREQECYKSWETEDD